MKKTVLTTMFALLAVAVQAQAPDILWQKSYGGTGIEIINSFSLTNDKGFIISGMTGSSDGDVTGNTQDNGIVPWILKLDSVGAIEWEKCYADTSLGYLGSIQQTAGEEFIFVGARLVGGNQRAHITKMDKSGNIEWTRTVGDDVLDLIDVRKTKDGGYIAAGDGNTNGDRNEPENYCLVKFDSEGFVQWKRILGGSGSDFARSVEATSDSGYILAGYTTSTDGDVTDSRGDIDCWIVKFDSKGYVQWKRALGGTGDDRGEVIRQTPDGGYIIGGSSSSSNGDVQEQLYADLNYWIVKLSGSGSLELGKTYGGHRRDEVSYLTPTTDRGYLIVGHSRSADGDVTDHKGEADYWVLKTDGNGTLQWQKSLGGTKIDFPICALQTADGAYVIAGSSSSIDGDITHSKEINEEFISRDYWIVKLAAEEKKSGVNGAGDEAVMNGVAPLVYPNPVAKFLIVENIASGSMLEIINVTGKAIVCITDARTTEKINVQQLPAGIYFLRIRNNDVDFNKKILILH